MSEWMCHQCQGQPSAYCGRCRIRFCTLHAAAQQESLCEARLGKGLPKHMRGHLFTRIMRDPNYVMKNPPARVVAAHSYALYANDSAAAEVTLIRLAISSAVLVSAVEKKLGSDGRTALCFSLKASIAKKSVFEKQLAAAAKSHRWEITLPGSAQQLQLP